MRFPGQWQNLGGLRVGPYTCNFGTKWLQVKTKAQLTGRKVFEGVTPAAMKNADKITETSPTWNGRPMIRPEKSRHHAYPAVMPPSTTSSDPVVNADLSDNNHTTASATSAAPASRPSGI
jgi:hypothetical protein